jgi:peroxiredoxin
MYRLDTNWSSVPQPRDDGGARHLVGRRLPPVSLPGSDGVKHGLADRAGITVLFTYPLAGRLDAPLPHDWDCLPGARGCVPQLCAYRRNLEALRNWKVQSVFGISTQTSDYQAETVRRLDLPFVLLSDADHHFMKVLHLPTFNLVEARLLKRLTMIVIGGRIAQVFYPVFPPDRDPQAVIDWLDQRERDYGPPAS